jgi:endoglucanase
MMYVYPHSRSIALAIVLFCCARVCTAQPAFPLYTAGPHIVDSTERRVRLNAVNWYGAESADYVVGGLQTASLTSIVSHIKALGFNAVRLPWSNELYERNPVVPRHAVAANTNMKGERALTVLDRVISALSSAGIMVILDNHNSSAEWCCSETDGNTLWYNSRYPESSWIADWQGIVRRYAGNPWVIGADLRNEPRGPATWGGSASTDWHAAAQRGGNAVLGVNPKLLIFVEGVNFALDLSGVAGLPVRLDAPNHLVYEAHDYGYNYSALTGYGDYVSRISPRWGYLVSGNDPQPIWIGEFGTCNTATACVSGDRSSGMGAWFGFLTTYLRKESLDWSYWAVNGTQSTGRTYGAAETYGVFDTAWNASALPALTSQLQALMDAGRAPALGPAN